MNTLSIAAAIVAGLTGAAAGLSIGIATSKAVEATARQPEAGGRIMQILLLGGALAEATAIYGLLVAIMLILLKP
ncbi:MAG TPA: ATP F0F1 synthase subunit C [Clostridia bacterium]|nr:ATP F0F1 synthase subunit C [Clostridia bacterium]